MEIKNLSQLKKAIAAKTPFTITQHFIRPDLNGQTRIPNVAQTTGFYSIVKDEPQNPISQANNGKGYWLSYGKASDWTFENGTCTLFDHRNNGELRPVWQIQFH